MKSILRTLSILLLLALCVFLSCCKKQTGDPSSESIDSSAQTGSGAEEPVTPAVQDPLEALLQCIRVTEEAGSFSASSEGTCSTQVLFLSYIQQIRSSRTVTADAAFSQSVSVSSLVRVGVQQYFRGNTVLVRNGEVHSMDEVVWAEEPTSVTPKDYRAAYGKTPRSFSNYIITADTVLSARLESASDGRITVVCELDPDSSTAEYAKQVKTMGGLDGLPVFHSVTLTVTMDDAFRPISVRYQETYDISLSLLGNTTCKADYTETFSAFDAVTAVPEQAFFEPFLQLPTAAYPEISSGYSLLFSLLGNSASYDLTVEAAGQAFPLQLSLDSASGAILLRGETAEFLYDNDRYYLLSGENRVFADAEAFNERFLPLTELLSQAYLPGGEPSDGKTPSFLSGFDVRTENGTLLLHAGDEEAFVRVTVDLRSLSLLSAELRLPGDGSPVHLLMEKTTDELQFPVLSGCTDLTPSLSALSFLDMLPALRDGETLSCRVQASGETAYTADLALALDDQLSFSLRSNSDALPLSVYGKGKTVTAVWEELSLTGEYGEFAALLSLFSDTRATGTGAAARIALPRLFAEPGKLTLRFEKDFSLTFAGSELLLSGEEGYVRVSILGTSDTRKVPSAPKCANRLSVSRLNRFLSGSVYPAILRAGTVSGDLDLTQNGEPTHAQIRARLTDSPAVALTTVWMGAETNLLYTDETLFLSHPIMDAFLPMDRLPALAEQFGFLSGSMPSLPSAGTQMPAITSVSCDGETLVIGAGDVQIVLEKNRIRLSGADFEAIASDLAPTSGNGSFSAPDRRKCVDLASLAEKLAPLMAQKKFAFTGSYTDEDTTVAISRLAFLLNADREILTAAVDFLPTGMDTDFHLLYEDGCLFLDAGETHLFFLAEALFPDGDFPLSEGVPGLTGDLFSELRKIAFRDGILEIETAEASIRLIWNGDALSQISYRSGEKALLLRSTSFTPLPAPQLELYTDLTPLAGLLRALGTTAEAGSFAFDGQIDLRAFSLTLRGIKASGCFRFSEQGVEGTLAFDLPYLPGITSDGIPLMRANQPLTSCTLRSELFLTGGKLYMRRTANASYGLLRPQTYTLIETGYLTIEEALSDPMRVLAFLLRLDPNLETGGSAGGNVPDGTRKGSLIKRASCAGNLYTVELNPQAFLPAADSMILTARTDGIYLTGMEAAVTFSPLSIVVSGTLSSHGTADPSPAFRQEFSEYQHLA